MIDEKNNKGKMSKKSSPCPFGKIIVSAREERGITQYRLAQLTGRSVQQLSQIERGEREPKLSTVVMLAHALDMEPGIWVNEAAKVMCVTSKRILGVDKEISSEDKTKDGL